MHCYRAIQVVRNCVKQRVSQVECDIVCMLPTQQDHEDTQRESLQALEKGTIGTIIYDKITKIS